MNQNVSDADERRRGDGRDVAGRNHGQRASAGDAPGPRSPSGSSRRPMRRFNGRLERTRLAPRPPKPDQCRNAEDEHDGDAIAYARASQATRPPLATITRIIGRDGDVDGAGRGAEARMERREPARQRALRPTSGAASARRRRVRREPPGQQQRRAALAPRRAP